MDSLVSRKTLEAIGITADDVDTIMKNTAVVSLLTIAAQAAYFKFFKG